MKTGFIFLLVISLFCVAANALQCYSCAGATSNEKCNQNIVNCTALLDTCMTTVTEVVGISTITKICSTSSACSTAAAGNVNVVVGSNKVTCCQTNLCNVNGFAITRLNFLLLGLPAALLGLSHGPS